MTKLKKTFSKLLKHNMYESLFQQNAFSAESIGKIIRAVYFVQKVI